VENFANEGAGAGSLVWKKVHNVWISVETAGEESGGFSKAFGGQADHPHLDVRSVFWADYRAARLVLLFHRLLSFFLPTP